MKNVQKLIIYLIFAYQLHFNRSPWLLRVESWNLNWNQISDDIFVFGSWGVALSSRSRDSLKDRDAIHEAISIQHRTVLCDYWEFRAQNVVGIEISDSIFVFWIGVPHCPLDREPHWEIEMPFVKRPVYNVHRIFSVTIGSLELKF